MDYALPLVSIVLAIVAVSVAVWQGFMARSQLTLARQTNGETDRALTEIKELVRETRSLTEQTKTVSAELKSAFDEKIGRVFDQYLTSLQRRADSEHEKDAKAGVMAEGVMGFLGNAFKESLEKARREAEAKDALGEAGSAASDDDFDPPRADESV